MLNSSARAHELDASVAIKPARHSPASSRRINSRASAPDRGARRAGGQGPTQPRARASNSRRSNLRRRMVIPLAMVVVLIFLVRAPARPRQLTFAPPPANTRGRQPILPRVGSDGRVPRRGTHRSRCPAAWYRHRNRRVPAGRFDTPRAVRVSRLPLDGRPDQRQQPRADGLGQPVPSADDSRQVGADGLQKRQAIRQDAFRGLL